MEIQLPIAEKPLRKGYNFFASGHVSNIKLNSLGDITHVWADVLASMKENNYDVKVVIHKYGVVVDGKLQLSCRNWRQM